MKHYTPRRSSNRWLSGAPAHVLDLLYFKKSGTWEALYTGPLLLSPPAPRTFANTRIMGREMSENPRHPQGVGMSFELSASDAARYRYNNAHRRVTWESLPDAVKRCIIADGNA